MYVCMYTQQGSFGLWNSGKSAVTVQAMVRPPEQESHCNNDGRWGKKKVLDFPTMKGDTNSCNNRDLLEFSPCLEWKNHKILNNICPLTDPRISRCTDPSASLSPAPQFTYPSLLSLRNAIASPNRREP
jgi:hypothetical protein